jgi:nucleotide-binding universal stress UspA family protein
MTIMVAVPDSVEGRRALEVAVAEARLRSTDLVVVNLALHPLDTSVVPAELAFRVVERVEDLDATELVLETLARQQQEGPVELLVIGMKRRSPVGKAVLGSLSQRLLLDAPVAVLAVKTGSVPRSPVPAG